MKSNKNEEKSSFIILIIGIVIIFLIVFNLDNITNLFSNSNEEDVVLEEEKEVIPTRYQCFYGPMVDSFYNYIKSEYVIFDFDQSGNVSMVTSEEKYQATTIDDYNKMLTVLSINTDQVSYDEDNYIVTMKGNSLDKFPKDYKTLNKYLSQNQYTCSKK